MIRFSPEVQSDGNPVIIEIEGVDSSQKETNIR